LSHRFFLAFRSFNGPVCTFTVVFDPTVCSHVWSSLALNCNNNHHNSDLRQDILNAQLQTWFWYCILNASFKAISRPDPGPAFGVEAGAAGLGHWYELEAYSKNFIRWVQSEKSPNLIITNRGFIETRQFSITQPGTSGVYWFALAALETTFSEPWALEHITKLINIYL